MTGRQKQHLLAYLGYYTAAVDGIWGPRSRQATLDFQQDQELAGDEDFGRESQVRIRKVIGEETADLWQGIRFFTREEFRCTCGGRGCSGFPAEPVQQLVVNAEQVRRHFGRPARVSSGVRCALRNDELPGSAKNSLHLKGRAMDFAVDGTAAEELLTYVRTLPGIREAYAIDGNYVHMGVEEGGSE